MSSPNSAAAKETSSTRRFWPPRWRGDSRRGRRRRLVKAARVRSPRAMPGPRNLITDVAGILIGNAADARLASGVTVALFEEPVVAAGLALGRAAGHRDATRLQPEMARAR